jgi:hypothetical protein
VVGLLLGEEIQEFEESISEDFNVLHDRLLVVNFRSLEKEDESQGSVFLFNFFFVVAHGDHP